MGVGGLGVVDVADTRDVGDVFDAVGVRAEGPQPVAYGRGLHAEGAGQCRRGQGVGDVVGGRWIDVADLGQLLGLLLPVGDEGPVDEDAVDHPEL